MKNNNPRVRQNKPNPTCFQYRGARARKATIFPLLSFAITILNKMVKSLKDIAPDLRPPPQSLISKVPEFLLFPTLVVLSLTISSALYSVASVFTIGDLSSVSRSLDDWWEVAGLIGWRIVVLAFGWWGEYDSAQLRQLERIFSLPKYVADPWRYIM